MRAVAWLWAGTVTWLFLIPLLIPEEGGLAIGRPLQALGSLAAILVVVLPGLRRLEPVRLAGLLVSLLALGVVIGALLGAPPLRELLAGAWVGGAMALAALLGRKLVAVEGTLEDLAAGLGDERTAGFDRGQEEIYREIRRARRYQRPATLMALSASGAEAPDGPLARELQREFAERYASARLAKLLRNETDAAAVVTRLDDHFVVLLPETEGQAAHGLARRLADAAAERWGLELRCGVAVFPDEEVTFEGLLERAEAELGSLAPEPSTATREAWARGALRLAEGPDPGPRREAASSGSDA